MKNNQDFLKGVYQKAELLEKKEKARKTAAPQFAVFSVARRAAVAAACLAVTLTSALFYESSLPVMEIPDGYQNLQENIPMSISGYMTRMMPENKYVDSDLIVTGKVTNIAKSVYEEENQSIITMVTILPAEKYKGELETAKLTVSVVGGINPKDRTYMDYEAVFQRGEDVLLFLTKRPDGSYILFGGAEGKYTRREKEGSDFYSASDGSEISLTGLKEELKKGGIS